MNINQAILDSIPSFGPKTQLRDAIEYALRNGGKRFRPMIISWVARALGNGLDITDCALAVEYFHTASLIADDLPCMDDDATRRDQPAVHKVFGESIALLATYALIAAGYDRLRLNGERQGRPELIPLALENATLNTGILGATGGQFGDLFPGELTEAFILDVIDKKTGTLFELSFVLGWLFGGGDLQELEKVKKAAKCFGRAFQISDDFLDLAQDEGKLNLPLAVGEERAMELLLEELGLLKALLSELRLDTPELLSLVVLIEQRLQAQPLFSH